MANGIETTEIVILIISAIIGAIVAATLRWLGSPEGSPVRNNRQFAYSVVKGAVAAIAFVFRYQDATTVTIWDYLTVFIGSAGFDSLLESVSASRRPP